MHFSDICLSVPTLLGNYLTNITSPLTDACQPAETAELFQLLFALEFVYFESSDTGNGNYKAINPVVSSIGDFTPFYIAIAICSVILGLLLILNIVCCFSRHSNYWLDRHTGNRWLVSIWSATPHKQPPLDFTELESQASRYSEDYHNIHKYSSEVPPSISQQPLTSSQEYLELHKRESDI